MERKPGVSISTNGNTEPPAKKIKTGHELEDLINECYDLKCKNCLDGTEQTHTFRSGLREIRGYLEQATSSSDISFGSTRISTKINWAKCLEMMLEDEPESLKAMKILTDKLNPGGALH